MCYSPEASFVVGGAAAVTGGYCLWAAWRKDRRTLPLAAIPALLGLQQVSEGFVWLALEAGDPDRARQPALLFLFFALAFWPFWFPFVAALGATTPARQRVLGALALVSTGWFWVLYYPILADPDGRLNVSVMHHSVRYAFDLPVDEYVPRAAVRLGYFLSLVVPMILGPRLLGPLPGLVLAGSAVVAGAVYEYAFASVWCFFAAVLGLWLSVVFYRLPPRGPLPASPPAHSTGIDTPTPAGYRPLASD